MKRLKTAMGMKRIDDNSISVGLHAILKEHRSVLINKLITGLSNYIDYKFNTKINAQQLKNIINRLEELKASRIDHSTYATIVEDVEQNDFTYLDNKIFYNEIDWTIKSNLFQTESFAEPNPIFGIKRIPK